MAEILERKLLASGKFIALRETSYRDDGGCCRRWEDVTRIGVGANGATVIIARIVPQNEILLVRQFRVPVGRKVLEFPAGLIDNGETPEQTATRELMEETGYVGKVIASNSPSYSSPGLTAEAITPVMMEIDGEFYRDHTPTPRPDVGEFIETFRVPIPTLPEFLAKMESEGTGVDSKLYVFAYVLGLKNI